VVCTIDPDTQHALDIVNERLAALEAKVLGQPAHNSQSTPCQHEWKEFGSGFIMRCWSCVKCGEVTTDY
jgi:hypothetical protein